MTAGALKKGVNNKKINLFKRLYRKTATRGFSDSTRGRVVTDYKNRQKGRLLSALQLMSISQISTQKYESGHVDPF